MSVQVIEANNKKQIKEFIKLPFTLYKDNKFWVPPLISEQKKFFNPEKNPYYQHSKVQLFLAKKNNEVVGRIAALTNTQHNKTHNDKIGFFGFFEAINDEKVAKELLDKAKEWLRKQNCDTMRGPMNFSVNDECGLLIDGFDKTPCIMMPYNKAFYDDLLQKNGMKKAKDLFAYMVESDGTPERLARMAQTLQKRGKFTVRSLSKKNLRQDIVLAFDIYAKAWENNWGYVPMTKVEFDYMLDHLLPVIDPELVFIAEVEGVPAGFSVALPDYNFVLKKMGGKLNPITIAKALYFKSKITTLRVITMGVLPEYHNKGIDAVLNYNTFEIGGKKGYKRADLSWVLEDNTSMNNVANKIGAYVYKKYRIYDIEL